MLDNLGGPNVIAKALKSRRRNQNRDPERERAACQYLGACPSVFSLSPYLCIFLLK